MKSRRSGVLAIRARIDYDCDDHFHLVREWLMNKLGVEGEKILITGVSGQCGRGLAHVLAKNNEVHGVARFSNPEIKDEIEGKGCVAWQMDMSSERGDTLPDDFDIVIHEAVAGMDEVNTLEEQNAHFHVSCDFVGDLMYRNEKALFALISTRSVYKHGLEEGCKEDSTLLQGENTYTAGKVAMSRLARWIGYTFKRNWVELRYPLPFAPYYPHPKVDLCLEGKMYANAPDSIQQRTYITDLIHQTIASLDYAKPEGEVFNALLPEILTLAEFARRGATVAGVEPDPAAKETGKGSKGHWMDPKKSISTLGSSGVSLDEGLRRYLRARQENILTPEDWMFEPLI